MKIIEFGYSELPGKKGTLRPIAAIYLVNGKRRILKTCIIDTGADMCTFPLSFLQLLGINAKKVKKTAKQEDMICACGKKPHAKGYFYPISICLDGLMNCKKSECVKNCKNQIKVNAFWIEANCDPLLGRDGILNNFNLHFGDKIHFIPKK